jgi:hypothetical protein
LRCPFSFLRVRLNLPDDEVVNKFLKGGCHEGDTFSETERATVAANVRELLAETERVRACSELDRAQIRPNRKPFRAYS